MATAKKSIRKKQPAPFSWKKASLVAASVALMIAVTLQITLDVHFWRTSERSSNGSIVALIIQAVRALDKPAVIEPVSKKVYLPDADLVLPPYPQNMPNIEYMYNPGQDVSDAEASVTVTHAIDVGIAKVLNAQAQGNTDSDAGLKRIFNAVPDLQVCSRGVHVVFGARAKYDHLEFSKTLADGRTMYVYTEAKHCAYDLSPLVTYLRDAQSY